MFPGLPDDNNRNQRITPDRFNDFRQNIDNQNNYAFEEKRSDLSRSKNVFVGAVAGVFLAGVVGWFVLSPRYASNNNEEIPVIRRPQAAIKVQPSEPGGMEILNQDKTVYDIIDKKSADAEPGVEKLLPPPEEPQIPIITADVTDVKTTVDVPEGKEVDVKSSEVKTAEEIKDTAPAQALISQAQEIIKAESAPKPEAEEEKLPDNDKPLINLPSIAAQPQATTAPAPAETAAVRGVAKGKWTVQLMASPNQNAVKSSWTSLSKKHTFLGGQAYEIETADLGAKGTYYRLYVGAFADRVGADNLCAQLKSAGGSCIVKKR